MASLWQKMPPFLISHDFRANRKVGREISQDGKRGPFSFLTWNWSERPFQRCKTKGNRSLPPKSLNSFAQKTVICFHLKQLQDIAPGPWENFVMVCVKCYIPWRTWGDRITVRWYSELTQRAGLMTSTFRAASKCGAFLMKEQGKVQSLEGAMERQITREWVSSAG